MVTTCSHACTASVSMESLYSLPHPDSFHHGRASLAQSSSQGGFCKSCLSYRLVQYQDCVSFDLLSVQYLPAYTLILNFVTSISLLASASACWCFTVQLWCTHQFLSFRNLLLPTLNKLFLMLVSLVKSMSINRSQMKVPDKQKYFLLLIPQNAHTYTNALCLVGPLCNILCTVPDILQARLEACQWAKLSSK